MLKGASIPFPPPHGTGQREWVAGPISLLHPAGVVVVAAMVMLPTVKRSVPEQTMKLRSKNPVRYRSDMLLPRHVDFYVGFTACSLQEFCTYDFFLSDVIFMIIYLDIMTWRLVTIMQMTC